MLGKLIKHELRAMRNPLMIFFIIIASTTALSCITMLFIDPAFNNVVAGFSTLLFICVVLLYYMGLIVCSLGSNILIAIRFYKSCYTDEGYLTHTLPVSSKQLLWGKTFAYFIVNIVTTILIILSVMLLVGVGIGHFGSFADFSDLPAFSEINSAMYDETGISFVSLILFIVTYCIGSFLAHTIIMLGCVSLGQLLTKHRILGALLAYFGFYTLVQIVGFFAAIPMYTNILKAELMGSTMTMWELMGPLYITIAIIYIVIAVIMYFINLYMMTKRLNLE